MERWSYYMPSPYCPLQSAYFKHFSLHLGPAISIQNSDPQLLSCRWQGLSDFLETCLLHSLVIAVGLHRSSCCSGATDHQTCQMRGSMTLRSKWGDILLGTQL